MPVKIYVGRNSQSQSKPPYQFYHEHSDFITVTRKIWKAFHHLPCLYVVIADLQKPLADYLIISEYGLGVIDFKKYDGCIIYSQNDCWYTEYVNGAKIRIKAGSDDKQRENPHKQVQEYANEIRKKLISFTMFNHDWNSAKINTAVCFTHPTVSIERCKRDKDHLHRPGQPLWQDWEVFEILTSNDVPVWADALKFQQTVGRNYDPYKLSPKEVIFIAENILNTVEYPPAYELMPTEEPFGALISIENAQRGEPIYLYDDEILVGRDSKCRVHISEKGHGKVSNEHAQIIYRIDGVSIIDVGSKHRTYLNDSSKPLQRQKPYLLHNGDRISLGGIAGSPETYLCEFSTEKPEKKQTI